MAKLLITLDGVQVGEREVDQERITIGRRAHNDIVLDHIGVSGEHAAVVTILNDSFLEDLGSTNGTLVNGAQVRKHFLRNGDLVEIGRHRMRFVGEVAGTREAADFEKTMVLNRPLTAPRAPATGDVRTATVGAWSLSEPPLAGSTATPAVPAPENVVATAPVDAQADAYAQAIAALPANASAEQQVELLAASMAAFLPAAAAAVPLEQAGPGSVPTDPAPASGPVAGAAMDAQPETFLSPAAHEPPQAAGHAALADAAAPAGGGHADAPAVPTVVQVAESSPRHRPEMPAVPELPLASRQDPAGQDVLAAVATSVPLARTAESMARLQVLNGTAAGRILEISKPLTTIGRPAVQVAVISRRSDGYYLAQVDGEQPARLNGTPLVPHAVALHAHDVLEIAGVKLEFFFQP